jgi:tripartite-type tricarboxylate transporter receptor subunit TctC
MSVAIVTLGACAPASTPAKPTEKPAAAAQPTAKPAAATEPKPAEAAKPAAEAAKPAPSKPATGAVNKEEIGRQLQGKTITLTVGYAPGGGFDTIARLFVEYAPKYIPGNPKMVVTNMPGGDSLVAAQKTMVQRPDGLNWVLFIDGLIKRDILGGLDDFDAEQVTYLGTTDNAPPETFFMVRSAVGTSIKDIIASGRPLKIADARGGSGAQAEFAKLVGIPIDPVYGYAGTSEYFAAIDRGEADGTFRGDPTLIKRLFPDWVKSKTVTPVLFFDAPCCEDFIKEGGWEKPPLLTDVVTLTETQKRAYDAHNAIRATRVFALPPNVPDNLRIGLQEAFADTLKDPEFVAAMRERAGTAVALGTGEEIINGVRNMAQQPQDVRDILKIMYAID